ncbi:hypothetical protein EYC84_007671 [Monilinia fructicola]|uniref:Uncharacterized protein n=1 Tax=Monilinia fructicola TaxID=38448 RepID=A0A5M9JGY0_MONFR|nr:hypothetical protein EYC84_007671 [Monilinia fructicola]
MVDGRWEMVDARCSMLDARCSMLDEWEKSIVPKRTGDSLMCWLADASSMFIQVDQYTNLKQAADEYEHEVSADEHFLFRGVEWGFFGGGGKGCEGVRG